MSFIFSVHHQFLLRKQWLVAVWQSAFWSVQPPSANIYNIIVYLTFDTAALVKFGKFLKLAHTIYLTHAEIYGLSIISMCNTTPLWWQCNVILLLPNRGTSLYTHLLVLFKRNKYVLLAYHDRMPIKQMLKTCDVSTVMVYRLCI